MRIGYARVSTEDQRLDLQIAALNSAGCDRIFTDHGLSGGTFERPGLAGALKTLSAGDMLIVWRLDRLGRSLVNLVQLVDQLGRGGVEFKSLTESIDTSSSGGRLVFHMMAALSEFERALISERTRAGMEAARRNGQHLGRKPLLDHVRATEARAAVKEQGERIDTVAARYSISVRSLRRILDDERKRGNGISQCG